MRKKDLVMRNQDGMVKYVGSTRYIWKCIDRPVREQYISPSVLSNIYKTDIKNFSTRAAKVLGKMLLRHGVTNPQQWFEERLAVGGEYKMGNIDGGTFDQDDKFITLNPSTLERKNEYLRAHEMAHRATTAKNRDGFVKIVDVKSTSPKNGKVTEQYLYAGLGFGEAATEILGEVFTGRPVDDLTGEGRYYALMNNVASRVLDIFGYEIFFESMFFDPQILEREFDKRAGAGEYLKMIKLLDDMQHCQEKEDILSVECRTKVQKCARDKYKKIQSHKFLQASKIVNNIENMYRAGE